jgi:Protein of unknown function (DUF3592)
MKYLVSVLPWLLVATGAVTVVLSGQRLLHRHQLQTDGRPTSAIVQWVTTTGARSNQIEVAFRDASGKEWTKDFAVFSSQYRAGQSVGVVYLPINPQVAILGLREAGVTTRQEAVGAAAGSLALLTGAGWLVSARLRRRHNGP